MNLHKIKYLILNNLPKPIYNIFFLFWKYFIKPISHQKLKKFKGEELKNINAENLSFQIYINKENGKVDQDIYLEGVYEPFFLSIIKKHINIGDVFIDIGGNIGHHSLFASLLVGGSGKVIAFEPIERLYSQFQKSIEINNFKNIELFNFGCGDEEKEFEIFFKKENMGASSIVDRKRSDGSETIKIAVPDKFLSGEPKINFIKIDVEGFEYNVLRGLTEIIIKHHPKILIEYTPSYYAKADESHSEKIIEFLLDNQYNILDIENNKQINSFLDIGLNKNFPIKSNTNLLCT